ncbi:hypothetical protein QFC20_003701 [Naganishia adeliensis]|uniref:Uncharacterized protein n=1 Tax=Naganishia adeliensis TaxID=92952 RepID=A0ACC2WA79_9TREE|nr:hypothetical protein QFC20_003701 [Naganishia adeliensis]
MSKLGLCQSVRSIGRQIEHLSLDVKKALVEIVGSNEAWGLLYDNINYMDKVKHQSAFHHNTFTSAAVGNLVLLDASVALPNATHPQAPETVFRKVMGPTMSQASAKPRKLCASASLLRRSLQPAPSPSATLALPDILPDAALDKHVKSVMVTHIINGFLNANEDLEYLRASVPVPEAIFPLERKRSTLFPLPMQRCDEAKIDGNIDYFRQILKLLEMTDDRLEDIIIPTYGDVFSVDKVRLAILQCRHDLSKKHFDKFKFPEPFMGPFHLLLAVIHSFYVANAGSTHYQDVFSIIHTRIGLKRKTMKLDLPDYYEGDLYIKLHVAALSHLHMAKQFPHRVEESQDGGLFSFNKQGITMEELVIAAKSIADKQLDAGIEIAANNGANLDDTTQWDSLHLHGSSLFRHALLYTELRHCIKNGDPGRMKAVFPYLIPIFKATGKHKYANEMLEVMWRWKNEWGDVLKATMLGHTLVNEKGRSAGWKGINLWQEHDVRLHKVDFPASDARGSYDSNSKSDVSGLLHTLLAAKHQFFTELDGKTADSQAIDLRSPDHIMFLARDWHYARVVDWVPYRKSAVFECYPGELKPQEDISGDLKKKGGWFQADPLESGTQMLISGNKSLEAYVSRRGGRKFTKGQTRVDADSDEDNEVEVVPTYTVINSEYTMDQSAQIVDDVAR